MNKAEFIEVLATHFDGNKAEAARGSGRFKDEIAPVTIKGRKGDTIVSDDEYIRAGATIEPQSIWLPRVRDSSQAKTYQV